MFQHESSESAPQTPRSKKHGSTAAVGRVTAMLVLSLRCSEQSRMFMYDQRTASETQVGGSISTPQTQVGLFAFILTHPIRRALDCSDPQGAGTPWTPPISSVVSRYTSCTASRRNPCQE